MMVGRVRRLDAGRAHIMAAFGVGNTLTALVRTLRGGQSASKRGVFVKYWEIIADNLSKAGWSWGCVSAVDCNGRTIWIADAHRGDGKRFVVRADEKLTAFVELESGIVSQVQSVRKRG